MAANVNARCPRCGYVWTFRRNLASEIGDDSIALLLWDGGLVHRFATVDALSAFPLAPILGAT